MVQCHQMIENDNFVIYSLFWKWNLFWNRVHTPLQKHEFRQCTKLLKRNMLWLAVFKVIVHLGHIFKWKKKLNVVFSACRFLQTSECILFSHSENFTQEGLLKKYFADLCWKLTLVECLGTSRVFSTVFSSTVKKMHRVHENIIIIGDLSETYRRPIVDTSEKFRRTTCLIGDPSKTLSMLITQYA